MRLWYRNVLSAKFIEYVHCIKMAGGSVNSSFDIFIYF